MSGAEVKMLMSLCGRDTGSLTQDIVFEPKSNRKTSQQN